VNNKIIKIIASLILFLAFAAPSYSEGVYILCYHAFLERKDPYSFSKEQFKDQLTRLKNSGFTFVAYEDVINNRIKGNKNILVSIDDGNHTVYQTYYSILKPMGIKPLLGIYPAIINRMHYAMTWDQIKELAADGCYIASHGYHHMFLSEKYYKQDPISFKKEIYLSKKILEEKLNRKIDTMIYPFGVTSDTAISELKNAGYKYGLTIEPKGEPLPFNNNFRIHRYLMTKPGQKGVIAFITKNAGVAQNETAAGSVNTAQNQNQKIEEKNTTVTDKISLTNYPDKIKKIVSADLIFIPAKTETKDKKNVKFKPFVHNAKSADSKNKNKKISAKTEKKNQRKKKTA